MTSTDSATTQKVHPFAALFPMMGPEEFADLVDDIRENGLVVPLKRDVDGLLIDGRNRLAACQQVGVEPHWETLPADTDRIAYIISVNVQRRHMSQGQRAMAVAQGQVLRGNTARPSQAVLAQAAGTSRSRIVQADMVLRWAPELAEAVMDGASLNEAYAIAVERKRQADAEARALRDLERDHPDLALQVTGGTLTLTQAVAAADVREQAAQEEAQVAHLRETIQLAYEQIGDEVPLPPAPDLTVRFTPAGREPEFARGQDQQSAALDREHAFIRRLVAVRDGVQAVAAEPVLTDLSFREGHLNAVRNWASQMVQLIYGVVETHDKALAQPAPLRKVR